MYERLTISEAAIKLGISTEGVRQRLKRGKLESEKDTETGRTYVYLDTEQESNNIPNTNGNPYTDALRSQIEELQGDKAHLQEETLRLQQIIMALSQKLPEPQQESVVLKEITGAAQEVGEKAVRGISRWRQWFRA